MTHTGLCGCSACYLVLDLGIDWRWGAEWFESLLLDHDVASNWGNWNAAAGLTGGVPTTRQRRPLPKQSQHDGISVDSMTSGSRFLNRWVPHSACRVNKFNIVKQSKDYDLKAEYLRHWERCRAMPSHGELRRTMSN